MLDWFNPKHVATEEIYDWLRICRLSSLQSINQLGKKTLSLILD